jgi:hypothetical protein
LLRSIDRQLYPAGALNYQNLTLLHQLCRLLSSGKYRPKLAAYVCQKGGYPLPELRVDSLIFEQRSILERHLLLQLAWWLMTHGRKIKAAVQGQAIRINLLYRDLDWATKNHILNIVMK